MKMIWKFVQQETKFLVLYFPYTSYFCVIVGHKLYTEYLTHSQLTITHKGQLISKCLFGVIISTKIPTKNLTISALEFEKW